MIVFLHLPKTAGSTFQFILENSFGISACHTNHTKQKNFDQRDFRFAQRVFPGLKSIAGHNLIDPLKLVLPDPFFLTILREPVARVISHYQESVLGGTNRLSFEETMRTDDFLENLQVKMIAGGRDLDKAKRFLEKCAFVGLTEKFDLSLHVLRRLSPCKLNLNYVTRRVHEDNSIKKSLLNDPRIVGLVRENNKLDLELYEFAVNEIFPKLCARAGFDPAAQVASFQKYSNYKKPKFLACQIYNMLFYRQLCKLAIRRRNKSVARNPTAPQ